MFSILLISFAVTGVSVRMHSSLYQNYRLANTTTYSPSSLWTSSNSSLVAMYSHSQQHKLAKALASMLFSSGGTSPSAIGGRTGKTRSKFSTPAKRNALGRSVAAAVEMRGKFAIRTRSTRDKLKAATDQYSLFNATGKTLEIAMFDFDQTLSREHVFSTLSGDGFNPFRVGEPAARSPYGQISKLVKESHKYNALWAFGGSDRIAALRDMLERLRMRGVKMMICTLGYPCVVRKLLEEAGLLRYFGWAGVPSVVGMADLAYAEAWTRYDHQARHEFRFAAVRSDDEVLKVPKVKLLDQLLQLEGKRMQMDLPLSAGVIVEDDPEAILDAQSYWRDSGSTFFRRRDRMSYIAVRDRQGMQKDVEMLRLLRMADALDDRYGFQSPENLDERNRFYRSTR